jgi:hypothetical protein
MNKVKEILKTFKEVDKNAEFTVGQLFNAVHQEWNGEQELKQFNNDVENLDKAGLIVVTPGSNIDRPVRVTDPGQSALSRLK